MAGRYRVGVDIGGTFTDLAILSDSGIVALGKGLTTHDEPARAVQQLLVDTLAEQRIDPAEIETFVHGTTLVTNALIERRGAMTALVTTEGFRDVVEMGREHRYELYDLDLELARPLVPRHLRFGVGERTLADGTVRRALDRDELAALAAELRDRGVRAVAVCFLHSHVNGANEVAARQVINEVAPEIRVALSSEINPEIREYERFSTTLANVYVQDLVESYLSDLRRRLAASGVRRDPLIMLSNGGVATIDVARRHPIKMLESGPAGGALGAVAIGAANGYARQMAFDMGGTTAKLCMIEDGHPVITHSFEVDRVYRLRSGSGLPVRAPVIDMIEIGAGGGSIARVDSLGLITVGPDSAGSEPGPVSYGRGGTRCTVTDADLVLGYLGEDTFLGGSMRLDRAAAVEAIRSQIADPLGLTAEEAAWGIVATVDANMANAARVHAIERGFDPQGLLVFVSGGNGPVHGPGVARAMGASQVLVPPAAGVLSAMGFLAAPMRIDAVRSQHAFLDSLQAARAEELFASLRSENLEVLSASEVDPESTEHQCQLDMRYVGQGAEVTVEVPWPHGSWQADVADAFAEEYQRRFGTVAPQGVEIEVLTWRVTSSGPDPRARLRPGGTPGAGAAQLGSRAVYFAELGMVETPIIARGALAPGAVLPSPCLVQERESTAVVPPRATAVVQPDTSILITFDEGADA